MKTEQDSEDVYHCRIFLGGQQGLSTRGSDGAKRFRPKRLRDMAADFSLDLRVNLGLS